MGDTNAKNGSRPQTRLLADPSAMPSTLCILLSLLLCLLAPLLGGEAIGSPIAFDWIYATVKIENEWGQTGTGFLVVRPLGNGQVRLFLVTNKHVISEDAQKRESARTLKLFLNKEDKEGTLSALALPIPLSASGSKLWREHSNPLVDVLVVDVTSLFRAFPEIKKQFIGYSFFATPELLAEEDITIGEEVLVIGYPLGIAHSRTSIPLVRQGIIATSIGERIYVDVRSPSGELHRLELPGFLVDASIIPGSSGSPVVLKPTIGRRVHSVIKMESTVPYLLGIVSATKIAALEINNQKFYTLAGLGIVFDAVTIRETIELFFK